METYALDSSAFTISSEALSGVMTVFTDNAMVILPVGVALIAAFAGLRMIPKLIKTFTKG